MRDPHPHYFWRGFTVGVVAALGLACVFMLFGCASTGGNVSDEGIPQSDRSVTLPAPLTPWLTPTPLTIYELNQTPDTIRHAFILSGGGKLREDRRIAGKPNTSRSLTDGQVAGYPNRPAAQMFLWSYVSRQGVARYSPMTGGVIPQTPVTIITRETGGRI